ncbi:MAG: sigma-E processing peptidase SpoIIGA [Bacillota bacterium]|nr:sigma-E processing peptidase SpoIIGA [Bacillota bacterium]
MEVYLDVLFLENLVMNFLILMVTSKFSKRKTSTLRLFIGAFVGALYVVFLLICPGFKIYYTAFSKFALSLLIVALVFTPKKVWEFIKILVLFYASTFIFAGAAFAFLYFNQNGGFLKNGVVYVFWQSQTIVLLLSVVTVGIIVRIFWEIFQHRFERDKLLIPLKISFESKKIGMAALIDTGNSLFDPLSNLPVVVVEFNALREILPEEIKNIYENSRENDLTCVTNIISNSEWIARFRLIPFSSLGKQNGMLLGFKPDYIEIGENQHKKDINEVIIGIYNSILSRNERYKALLNPELVG